MAEERKKRKIDASRHIQDTDEARKHDAFCRSVMERGKSSDAIQWIQTKSHTLGERSWSSSRSLMRSLSSLGCLNIYACQIDSCETGMENTGHLVIELPKTGLERKKVFQKIDRLAKEQGYSGPLDDGQRYAYVKLD